MKTSALHSSNLLKCKWSNMEHVPGKQLSNAPAGTGTFQSYLSIIYFQWVEFFGIFSEVLRMPRIAGFLFIQVKEVFNSIFFWWHLLQLVTPNYSAHTTPGSKHPVPTEVKHEKKTTDIRFLTLDLGTIWTDSATIIQLWISHFRTMNLRGGILQESSRRATKEHMSKNWRNKHPL